MAVFAADDFHNLLQSLRSLNDRKLLNKFCLRCRAVHVSHVEVRPTVTAHLIGCTRK